MSQRGDISPASREMGRLAGLACCWSNSIRGWESQRNRERRPACREDWDWPGYMIGKQSEATRELLRALTSADVLVARVPLILLHEEPYIQVPQMDPRTFLSGPAHHHHLGRLVRKSSEAIFRANFSSAFRGMRG